MELKASREWSKEIIESPDDYVILSIQAIGNAKNAEVTELCVIDLHRNVLLYRRIKPSSIQNLDELKRNKEHWSEVENCSTFDRLCKQLILITNNKSVLNFNAPLNEDLLRQSFAAVNLHHLLPEGFRLKDVREPYSDHLSANGLVNLQSKGSAQADCYAVLKLIEEMAGKRIINRREHDFKRHSDRDIEDISTQIKPKDTAINSALSMWLGVGIVGILLGTIALYHFVLTT